MKHKVLAGRRYIAGIRSGERLAIYLTYRSPSSVTVRAERGEIEITGPEGEFSLVRHEGPETLGAFSVEANSVVVQLLAPRRAKAA